MNERDFAGVAGAAGERRASTANAPAPDVSGWEPLTLVCLGGVPWGNSWKRIQSMSYLLAQLPPIDRLVFVNPREVWMMDELRSRPLDWRHLLGVVAEARTRCWGVNVRILTMTHLAPLITRWQAGRDLELRLFNGTLDRAVGRRPYILLNNHPVFFSPRVLARLEEGAALKVFDISDDFVEYFEQPDIRERYARSLRRCCAASDVVLAVNEHVAQKYGSDHPHTHVIHNATNVENFDRSVFRPIDFLTERVDPDRPLLGYSGIINRVRIDYELLIHLLEQRPRWQFLFVGSADASFVELASKYSNVYYHPAVVYEWLPDWIAPVDVAIVPFRINEHTRGNDMLKVYDYLAMGKSIVSTDTAGIRRCAEYVRIAQDPSSFLEAIEAALAEGSDARILAMRKRFAREHHSWERRSREVHTILMDRLAEVQRSRRQA